VMAFPGTSIFCSVEAAKIVNARLLAGNTRTAHETMSGIVGRSVKRMLVDVNHLRTVLAGFESFADEERSFSSL